MVLFGTVKDTYVPFAETLGATRHPTNFDKLKLRIYGTYLQHPGVPSKDLTSGERVDSITPPRNYLELLDPNGEHPLSEPDEET